MKMTGDQVRDARIQMMLSVGLMADCLGIDKRVYERLEAGTFVITPPVEALLKAYRDSPDALERRLKEVNP